MALRDIMYLAKPPAAQQEPAPYVPAEFAGKRDAIVNDEETALETQRAALCAQVTDQINALRQCMATMPRGDVDADGALQSIEAAIAGLEGLLSQMSLANSFYGLIMLGVNGALDVAQRVASAAVSDGVVQSSVLNSEMFQTYSAEYQRELIKFEREWAEWSGVQNQNFEAAEALTSKYGIQLDTAEREKILDKIKQEEDPLAKAALMVDLAETDLTELERKRNALVAAGATPEDLAAYDQMIATAQQQIDDAKEREQQVQRAAAVEAEKSASLAAGELEFAIANGDENDIKRSTNTVMHAENQKEEVNDRIALLAQEAKRLHHRTAEKSPEVLKAQLEDDRIEISLTAMHSETNRSNAIDLGSMAIAMPSSDGLPEQARQEVAAKGFSISFAGMSVPEDVAEAETGQMSSPTKIAQKMDSNQTLSSSRIV